MKKFAGLFFLVSIVNACGEKQDPVQGDAGLMDIEIGYCSQIKPILDANCIRCHSTELQGAARNGAPIDVNLNDYENVKAKADRANARIQGGTMPPSGSLSGENKAWFQQWVDQGLKP